MSDHGQLNPEPVSVTSPRTRRARRPAQSCEPCRRRKVRCDLGTPCSACRQSRGRMSCTYSSSARHSTSEPNPNPAIATTHEQQTVPEETPRAPGSSRRVTTSSVSATVEERLLNTERRMQSIEKSLTPRNGHNTVLAESSKPFLVPHNTSSSSSEAKGLTIVPTIPLVRNTAEKVKLFGSSHWLHTAAKVSFNIAVWARCPKKIAFSACTDQND